jgi:AmmeMemoRadiSam system protein A
MQKHSPDFEKHVVQIAALGAWQMVTGGQMKRRLEVDANDHRWSERHGLFVTIRKGVATRGSMGVLESDTDLQELLFETGGTASTHDKRYAPIIVDELPGLEIEVTLLSEIRKIASLDDIVIGTTGLIVTRGEKRSVLLPHVPVEYNWSPEVFIEACCEKAQLSHKAWRDENTLVEYFTSFNIEGGALLKLIEDFV